MLSFSFAPFNAGSTEPATPVLSVSPMLLLMEHVRTPFNVLAAEVGKPGEPRPFAVEFNPPQWGGRLRLQWVPFAEGVGLGHVLYDGGPGPAAESEDMIVVLASGDPATDAAAVASCVASATSQGKGWAIGPLEALGGLDRPLVAVIGARPLSGFHPTLNVAFALGIALMMRVEVARASG